MSLVRVTEEAAIEGRAPAAARDAPLGGRRQQSGLDAGDVLTDDDAMRLAMNNESGLDLKKFIRDIPDFPKPGILFRDITPLLMSPKAFGECVQRMATHYQDRRVDVVVAAEARGFIFAAPLALQLQAAFVPIRKPGKLPFDTHAFHYELEYGRDTLEMHIDGVTRGQNVLVVDDLLATGGTVDACCQLLDQCGARIVGCAFAIELLALNGARRIADYETFSLIQYR